MIKRLLNKFVLNYIRKNACLLLTNDGFMDDVMVACHRSHQENERDQTVPGRIYSVFESCAKAIPDVIDKSILDDPKLRRIILTGINNTVREVLQLPTIEEDNEENFQRHIETKNW